MGFIAGVTVIFAAGNLQDVLANGTQAPFVTILYNSTHSKAGTVIMLVLIMMCFMSSRSAKRPPHADKYGRLHGTTASHSPISSNKYAYPHQSLVALLAFIDTVAGPGRRSTPNCPLDSHRRNLRHNLHQLRISRRLQRNHFPRLRLSDMLLRHHHLLRSLAKLEGWRSATERFLPRARRTLHTHSRAMHNGPNSGCGTVSTIDHSPLPRTRPR